MARVTSLLIVLIAAIAGTASLSFSLVSAAKCHLDDKKALLAIKSFWNNPYRLASWVPTTGCCSWYGVACDSMTGRVTDFSLSDDANITGTIPPSLGDLPYLSQLDIHKLPNLKGPIPLALARLRKLTFLRLDENGLTGPIPAFLSQFPKLWYLNLGSNHLTGSIPAALGRLTKLRFLMLDHNSLTGPVPAEFGMLAAETALMLDHNNLSGRLPPALGAVDFSSIDLSSNQLSGDATFLFGQSKKELTYIDLSSNMFEFDLGRVVFPTYAELNSINLSHNRIYGRVPKQMASLAALVSLNLSYNRLCGEIPSGGNLDGFKVEVYAHNRCLCGKPLPPCK